MYNLYFRFIYYSLQQIMHVVMHYCRSCLFQMDIYVIRQS